MSLFPFVEFEYTVSWKEVLEVLTKNDQNSQTTYKVIVHLNDAGDEYHPLSMMELSLRRDYIDAFADEMGLKLLIPYGKYTYKIYPNRNNLNITIQKFFLKENSTEIDYDKPIDSETFGATLIEEYPLPSTTHGQQAKDEASLDLIDLIPVRFQLCNRAVEKIRLQLVGGTYRKETVGNIIRSNIDGVCAKINVPNQRKIIGADCVEFHNKKVYDQIIIPHGMKLIDVPGYIQNRYGVYNSGLGSYIQNSSWYVFSLYDPKRFYKTERTLTIHVIPKNKFPEIERTYYVLNKEVHILANNESDFRGDNEISYRIDGNGVRFVDADLVMNDYYKTKGNKAIAKRKSNINEFASELTSDYLSYSPLSNDRITANPFRQNTDLTRRKGGIFKFIWNNSNPALVEPGMPCKITYYEDNIVKVAYGTVLSSMTMTNLVGAFNSGKHVTNSQLQLYGFKEPTNT